MEYLAKKLTCILISVTTLIATAIPGQASPRVAEDVNDDVVLEWNALAYNRMPAGPPFPTLRYMATIQLAVFEAVNAITGKYHPYLGTVNAPAGASEDAAAISAAHDALVGLLPALTAELGILRDNSLAAIPDGQAKTDGIAVGQEAAAAMLANRTNDGSAPAAFYNPTSNAPYEWQLTPGPCATPGAGVFAHWRNVRPFAVESSSQFRAEPPPALDSGVYAQDFNEVQAMGGINSLFRTAERTDNARLWAVTGVATVNQMLQQIAVTRDDDITFTARSLAVLNMAIADASISVFDSKYEYHTWRPATAIQRGDDDGNKWTTAGAFTSLIGAPCFPSYPSAHATNTTSIITVLERTYGRQGHSVVVSHPAAVRTDGSPIVQNYSDLREIIRDVSDARVYGGIHFRFDQDAGEKQGHAVGQYVYNNSLQKLGND